MLTLYISEDNLIRWDEMATAADDAYVTSATGNMTLYKRLASDGAITAGDATLTCSSAPFVSGDAGRSIVVHGAGANGEEHRTTIATFTSSSAVELTDAAVKTASGALVDLSLDNAVAQTVSYVTTNGRYHGVLPSTVPLVDQNFYWLEITMASGTNDGFRRIQCVAQYHDNQC